MGHQGLRQRRQYESYEFDDISSESSQRRKRRASVGNPSSDDLITEDLNIVATLCGRETSAPKLFGVIFPNRSYPMDASNFTQVDSTHWVLDMSIFVGESYDEVKEICLFLLNEFSIPPEKALALHVQSPGSHFQYCGAVYKACPSAVLSLLWPNPGGQMQLTAPGTRSLSGKVGLAVEDVLSLPAFNVGQQRQIEALAMRVGENFFTFMQSFCSLGADKLIVPLDILNRWFKKFQEKIRRDSDYLNKLLMYN